MMQLEGKAIVYPTDVTNLLHDIYINRISEGGARALFLT
jgi:hypothetical protein